MRLAGVSDEHAILDLLLEDLDENATQVAPVSIERLQRLIMTATRQQGGFGLVIDGPTGKPVAVAILQPDPFWWSETVFLREICLYVTPSARHSRAGLDLLQAEKWIADRMTEASGERIFLMAGVTGTKRLPAKMRLYARSMAQVGSFHMYPDPAMGLSL